MFKKGSHSGPYIFTILLLQLSIWAGSTVALPAIDSSKQNTYPPPAMVSISEMQAPQRTKSPIPQVTRANPPIAHFTNFDTEQGLALSSILTTYTDKKGNLWFGTHGAGVDRFDGRLFHTYNTSNGLIHNSILSVFQDNKGNFWFGSFGGGVSFFDGRVFISYTTQNGLADNTVYDIFQHSNGDIWMATDQGGVNRVRSGEFETFNTSHGLISNSVYNISEDSQGNLWFATYGGVSKFNGQTFTNYTSDQGLAVNATRSITTDKQGNIWIGTLGGGVSMFNGATFANFSVEDGLADNTVWDVKEDRRGRIWFATSGGLSYYTQKEGFVTFTTEEGMPHNIVRSISEDRNGNIWIATFGGGVSRFNGTAITTYTKKQGLTDAYIRSINQDQEGNLWMGSNDNGVIKFDGEFFSNFTTTEGLSHNTIYAVFPDSRGNIWIGTNGGGVSRFDGTTFTTYTTSQGLIHNRILAIKEASNGELWFGSPEGASKFDGETFRNYTTEQGLTHNFIRNITEDTQGNIWFATYGNGVSKFDGETFENFNTKDGLAHDWVRRIMEDPQGNLWMGTYGGGLSRFDGSGFLTFSAEKGLVDNVVYDMAMDESGILWLGTNQGFSGLSFRNKDGEEIPAAKIKATNPDLTENYSPVWLEVNNRSGFPVKNLNSNSMHITTKELPGFNQGETGVIWGGFGDNKVIRFKPEAIEESSYAPEMVISQIMINDKPVSWYTLLNQTHSVSETPVNNYDSLLFSQHESVAYGRTLTPEERDSLRKEFVGIKFTDITPFYHIPENLVMTYNFADITISFGAIETGRNFLLNYQYKIEELDKEWRNIRQSTEISLGGLREGRYTFMVRAQNADGLTSNVASFQFRVLPPWYRTLGMYIFYGITALIAIWLILKMRVRKLKKEKHLLAKTVEKRTAELQSQKEEAERQKRIVEEKSEEISLQKEQITKQSKELEVINHNLEKRIAQEISKNREKEVMLIQQSRQAAMGEMIGNIAHQWRQPINAVSIIIQNIQDAHNFGELDEKYLNEKVEQSMEIIQYMSQTIDDFRNFFKPEKSKQRFEVKNVVEKCLNLIDSSLKSNNIKLEHQLPPKIFATGYSNEYAQVLLNILKNARDALLERKTRNPRIFIRLEENNGKSDLFISDNAGGIPYQIKDKIFHPYFTTKEPGTGTGLGLYMSKTIIEKNMGGTLTFINTADGAEFRLTL